MQYQITLKNLDSRQQLGTLDSQLKKVCGAIAENTPFTRNKAVSRLELDVYRSNIINYDLPPVLVFNKISLQEAVDTPADELNAWLTRIFKLKNIPFTVLRVIANDQAINFYQGPGTRFDSLQLSIPKPINFTGSDEISIIPGFQLACIAMAPIYTDIPIEAIRAYFLNFIDRVQAKFKSQVYYDEKSGKSIEFSGIYLHSVTKNSVIFVVPCDLVDDVSSDITSQLLARCLRAEGLQYKLVMTLYKRENCFSSYYPQTNNSIVFESLEIDETIEHEGLVCGLSYQVMDDPVELPNTKQIVDKRVIDLELVLNGQNPYNRQPLTVEQLIPRPDLKARIKGVVRELVENYIKNGTKQFKDSQFEQAIRTFLSVYKYCKGKNISQPSSYTILLNNLACCYREIYDFGKAIEYFRKLLLHDFENHIPLVKKAKHLEKLADVYLRMRLPALARKYYELALEIFKNAPDQRTIDRVTHASAECETLSVQVTELPVEPESLHAKTLKEEKEFYQQFCEIKHKATPPRGPFIYYSNAYRDYNTEGVIVPYCFVLKFDKTPEALAVVHQRYDVKEISEKILLVAIRKCGKPCLLASTRFINNAAGQVVEIEFSVILCYKYPPALRSLADFLYNIFADIRMGFMPNIGAYVNASRWNKDVSIARVANIVSQPNIVSYENPKSDGKHYQFGIIVAENKQQVHASCTVLETYNFPSCVVMGVKDFAEQQIAELEQNAVNLRELAWLYHVSDNPGKAIFYYRLLITKDRVALADSEGDSALHLYLACDLVLLGEVYDQQDNHSRSYNCFREALTEYHKGRIEEPDAVIQLQNRIDKLKPLARFHACATFTTLFKRGLAASDSKELAVTPLHAAASLH